MAALRALARRLSSLQISSVSARTRLHEGTTASSLSSNSQLVRPISIRTVHSSSVPSAEGSVLLNRRASTRPEQEVVEDSSLVDEKIASDVVARVNSRIASDSCGRLFAVVHTAGTQYRVTDGDLISIRGHSPVEIGDVIRLEKVLLVGSTDFTLLGRPILRPDLAKVEATVVEKSLTHTVTHFRYKRRKQYRRINFYRHPFSILRINSVRLVGLVDQRLEVEGVDGRVF